jgi:hypothetical protein
MSDRFGKLETRTTHLSDLLQAAAKPEQIAVSDIVKQLTAALSKKPDQEGSMVFYVPKEANDFVATPGSAGGFISNAVSSEPHHIVVFDAGGNGQDGKAVETAASGIIADWNHMDPKAKAKIGIVVEDSKVTPDDLKAMINILNNANEK